MFVKNIFRNKFKKISKKTCEKIKEQIDKSEFILLNFSEDIYLPEEKREEEVIHCSDKEQCMLLRYLRDKPDIFIDYIKKYHFTKQDLIINDYLEMYLNKKRSEIKQKLTKLDVDEYSNNIKSISNRLSKAFIVHDTIDIALKTFDTKEAIVFFNLKDVNDFKFLDKIKSSNIMVLSKRGMVLEFKKRNYEVLDNNLFLRK